MRFIRSIFVPEDDTCFQLYQATAESAVRELTRRATLPVAGITQLAGPTAHPH